MKASAQTLTLISSAYTSAIANDVDMKLAAESLEVIKQTLASDDFFKILDTLDEQVGRAGLTKLQQILVDLRSALTEIITSDIILEIGRVFDIDRNEGWKIWLNLFVRSFYSRHMKFCIELLSKRFPFPEIASPTLEKIRGNQENIRFEWNWTMAYDLYVHFAEQEFLEKYLQSYMFVIAALVDLWVYSDSNSAKLKLEKAKTISWKSPRVMCGFGEYYHQIGQYDEAIANFRNAIEVDPSLGWSYCGLGDCYQRKNQIATAEEYYEEALRKAPGKTPVYRKLCEFYGRSELFRDHESEILDIAKRMCVIDPELKYDADLIIARIYGQNQIYKKAHQFIDNAIAESQKPLHAYIERGYLYFNEGKYGEVVTSFKKAVEIAPDTFDGYWSLSWFFESNQEWNEAIRWYQESLKRRPQWENSIRAKISEMKWNAGNHSEACHELLELLKCEPNNSNIVELIEMMANQYYSNLGKLDDAIKVYDRIREIKGIVYEKEYHHNMANIHIFQKNWDDARNHVQEIYKIDKNEITYQKSLAYVLILEGNYELERGTSSKADEKYTSALNLYEGILRKNPTDLEAIADRGNVLFNLRKYNDALKSYNDVIEKGATDISLWISKADCHYIIGCLQEAHDAYNKVLEVDSENVDALIKKGITLRDLDKMNEAIKCFDKVLELNPHNILALYNKGWTLYDLNRFDDAIKAYDKILEIDAKDSDTWYAKGRSLYAAGNLDNAIIAYNSARELDPSNVDILIYKALAVTDLGRLEEAITLYNQAILLDPDNTEALFYKGYCQGELGKHDEAIKCYDKVLKLDPNDSGTLNNKAWILAKSNRNEEALEIINRALEIDPASDHSLDTKAFILYNLGQFDKSLEYCDKSLSINDEFAIRWKHKALALEKLGRKDEARECFSRAQKSELKS